MSLSTLLDLYEKRLQQYDAKTIETRTWILKTFRKTWQNGLEIPVRDVTSRLPRRICFAFELRCE